VSLRTRLLLALGAVSLVALVVADVVTYQELRSFMYQGVDQSLELAHRPFEQALGSVGPIGQHHLPPPQAADGTGALPGGGFQGFGTTSFCQTFTSVRGLDPGTFVEVRTAGGRVIDHCAVPLMPGTRAATPVLASKITGFSSNAADFGEETVYLTAPSTSGASSPFRVRASVLSSGPYKGDQLVVAVPIAGTVSTLARLRDIEIFVTSGALAAAALLGWWLVRVGMRPLRAVERTADAIADGELEQRVPGDRAKTEVGRLARALNVMLGRIEQAFVQRDRTEAELRDSEARMRQFVADASHELRTPLAAVSAYAELFERGASKRPEDLGRVMEGIRNETSRMGHLVDDLLLLARLDEGRPLERMPVELVELASESVRTSATVGPSWPVVLEATEPVEVEGDRARLRQVLDNLLANLRAHTPAGTSAVVGIGREGAEAIVTVSDDGPGLSPTEAAKVFKRFYRADPSRSRSQGGAGLGLSIVDSIVRAHGGTIEAAARPVAGLVFTVRLPLAQEPAEPLSTVEDRNGLPRTTGALP